MGGRSSSFSGGGGTQRSSSEVVAAPQAAAVAAVAAHVHGHSEHDAWAFLPCDSVCLHGSLPIHVWCSNRSQTTTIGRVPLLPLSMGWYCSASSNLHPASYLGLTPSQEVERPVYEEQLKPWLDGQYDSLYNPRRWLVLGVPGLGPASVEEVVEGMCGARAVQAGEGGQAGRHAGRVQGGRGKVFWNAGGHAGVFCCPPNPFVSNALSHTPSHFCSLAHSLDMLSLRRPTVPGTERGVSPLSLSFFFLLSFLLSVPYLLQGGPGQGIPGPNEGNFPLSHTRLFGFSTLFVWFSSLYLSHPLQVFPGRPSPAGWCTSPLLSLPLALSSLLPFLSIAGFPRVCQARRKVPFPLSHPPPCSLFPMFCCPFPVLGRPPQGCPGPEKNISSPCCPPTSSLLPIPCSSFPISCRLPQGVPGPEEGVSLHWKRSTFSLLDSFAFRFADLAPSVVPSGAADDPAAVPLMRVLMRREEGAVAALLQHRVTGEQLLATSTHIFWDPNYPDVKVGSGFVHLRNNDSEGGMPLGRGGPARVRQRHSCWFLLQLACGGPWCVVQLSAACQASHCLPTHSAPWSSLSALDTWLTVWTLIGTPCSCTNCSCCRQRHCVTALPRSWTANVEQGRWAVSLSSSGASEWRGS